MSILKSQIQILDNLPSNSMNPRYFTLAAIDQKL